MTSRYVITRNQTADPRFAAVAKHGATSGPGPPGLPWARPGLLLSTVAA